MELFLCIYGTNRERMSYMLLFLHYAQKTNASGAAAFLLRLLSQRRRSLHFRFGLVDQLHAVSLCSLPSPTRGFI